mmetsp:Transcript_62994/g.117833  ORF Transcript_62994/g.117833 Transcript_62994/m.117833 type:complete len:95 (-) Transcript_62994:740-1024(-)
MTQSAAGWELCKAHLVVIYNFAIHFPMRSRPHDCVRILKAARVHVELVVSWINALCVASPKKFGFFMLQATMILDFDVQKITGAGIVLPPSLRS